MESKKRNYRLLISDESGNPGPNTGNEIEYFVLGITSTKDSCEFEKIPDFYWSNTRSKHKKDRLPPGKGELKYGTSDDDIRSSVINDVSNIDNEIYALIVKKYPNSKIVKTGKDLYLNALNLFLKKTFENLPDDHYKVYIDDSWYLSDQEFLGILGDLEKSHPYKTIDLESGKRNSKFSKALQVNDFVVGAIKDKYILGYNGYGIDQLNIRHIWYMNSNEKHKGIKR